MAKNLQAMVVAWKNLLGSPLCSEQAGNVRMKSCPVCLMHSIQGNGNHPF